MSQVKFNNRDKFDKSKYTILKRDMEGYRDTQVDDIITFDKYESAISDSSRNIYVVEKIENNRISLRPYWVCSDNTIKIDITQLQEYDYSYINNQRERILFLKSEELSLF